MQCKDIDNQVFLDAVAKAAKLRGHSTASVWDVSAVLSDRTDLVGRGWTMKDLENAISFKLVRAKARKLIRSGKLDGCYCGCRGDFRLREDNDSNSH